MPVPLDVPVMLNCGGKHVDLSVCLLSESLSKYLEVDYRFLRLNNVWMPGEVLPDAGLFLVNGYPFARAKNDHLGKKCLPTFRYVARIYNDLVSKSEAIDETFHLLLKYEEQGTDLRGVKARNPALEGMSGCGIWAIMRPEAIVGWGADDLRLAAIQVRWHKVHRYLWGTKVNLLLRIIWENFPDTRDAMRLHGLTSGHFPPIVRRPKIQPIADSVADSSNIASKLLS